MARGEATLGAYQFLPNGALALHDQLGVAVGHGLSLKSRRPTNGGRTREFRRPASQEWPIASFSGLALVIFER